MVELLPILSLSNVSHVVRLPQSEETRWQTRVEALVTAICIPSQRRSVVMCALRNGFLAAFRVKVCNVMSHVAAGAAVTPCWLQNGTLKWATRLPQPLNDASGYVASLCVNNKGTYCYVCMTDRTVLCVAVKVCTGTCGVAWCGQLPTMLAWLAGACCAMDQRRAVER